MKTKLFKKYERTFKNIIDELANEADIETVNFDLKNLAEPFKISY